MPENIPSLLPSNTRKGNGETLLNDRGNSLAAIFAWMGFGLVSQQRPQLPPELSREEFLAEVRQGHVHEMTVWDKQVITGVSSTRGPFRTDLHADARNLTRELRVMSIQVFEKESRDSSPGPLF